MEQSDKKKYLHPEQEFSTVLKKIFKVYLQPTVRGCPHFRALYLGKPFASFLSEMKYSKRLFQSMDSYWFLAFIEGLRFYLTSSKHNL